LKFNRTGPARDYRVAARGYSVGVTGQEPPSCGVIDIDAADKMTRFVACATVHIHCHLRRFAGLLPGIARNMAESSPWRETAVRYSEATVPNLSHHAQGICGAYVVMSASISAQT